MYKMMLLLIVFTMLAACGTGGNSNEGSPETNDNSSGSEVTDGGEDNSDGTDDESDDTEESKEELKKDLERSKEGELAGQIERQNKDFVFTVTNNHEKDADIHFSSGKEYDYVVQDASGKTIKRLSTGMMYTQAIKELVLAPGESLEYPTTYKDVAADLPPGEYSIQFIFTGSNHHATAKETFTVE
ncbi:BsuPI-related putative proteinase inhibitor [Bacillus sp. CHD6a]|uniref:BsuPI-related putative proteinase inhibitor n=1 Tax=Bacillus sp. CHD6a TaxID=1643452 RepID=UPI0006CDCA48|nr:BsuPI-related putative proteinase inhibitor [Bacillus sp. CHD6a]KPB05679.1 hypothetical protein AAV98_05125 [Bacillus sp. CHD6a]